MKVQRLSLDTDTGIYGNDVLFVSQKRIDVHLLDFGGETQKGGEAHNNLGIALLIDTGLSARALYYLIGTQGADHAVGFGEGQGRGLLTSLSSSPP